MERNQVYKNRALENLEGNWTKAGIATLVLFIITGGIGTAFDAIVVKGISNLWTLLTLPLSWGYAVLFLHLIRQEPSSIERMFDGFKDYVRVFLLELLGGLATLGGLVLLIIPGIIVALGFSMSHFILLDNPEMSATDALKASWQMTKGHKMDLFWLSLSFIGWVILSFLTFGIGFLFLAPYIETTFAHVYEDLKAETI